MRYILLLSLLTGCGITNGSVTMGSTGYLKEANRRAIFARSRHISNQPMDWYSTKEKKALQAELGNSVPSRLERRY